jgi:hypothetical protein
MNTKMDNLVTMVTDIKERTVALADLPAQLQAGFTKVSGEISSFRKMVMQVGAGVWGMTRAAVMQLGGAPMMMVMWDPGPDAVDVIEGVPVSHAGNQVHYLQALL